MIVSLDKPDLAELAHHGVKGQKWGVHKQEEPTKETAQRNEDTKSLIAAAKPDPVSKAQATKNLQQNTEKAAEKFEKSDASGTRKRLTPTQKKVLIGGAVVVGVVGGAYLLRRAGAKPEGFISPSDFVELRQHSISNVWSTNNYLRPESFARSGFTLPKGHEFLRVSNAAETTFGHATYASSSVDDYARYLVGYGAHGMPAGDVHKVAFNATQDIKVPSLKTAIDTLREVIHEEGHTGVTDKELVGRYRRLSGGYWNEPDGEKLFRKLVKKGYSAIVDEMDAGVQSESPLVIINNNAFGPKTSTKLTAKNVQETMKSLREINNRKL